MTPPTSGLVVVSWGIASAVHGGGRTGRAHLGSSRGGAVDLRSLHLANRLVGNDDGMGAFETSGGLSIRLLTAAVVAVTGSQVDITVDGGPPVGWGTQVALPAGTTLRLGRLHGGARCYLAVRGGLSAPDGTVVAIGPEPSRAPATGSAVPQRADSPVSIWPGPRADWFTAEALDRLARVDWLVRAESDRVGARLAGPALERHHEGELPSEGLVEGSVQVPPDGQPIVMLADHPTTGGYPVIAVVGPDDIATIAQSPPGSFVRFRWAERPGTLRAPRQEPSDHDE